MRDTEETRVDGTCAPRRRGSPPPFKPPHQPRPSSLLPYHSRHTVISNPTLRQNPLEYQFGPAPLHRPKSRRPLRLSTTAGHPRRRDKNIPACILGHHLPTADICLRVLQIIRVEFEGTGGHSSIGSESERERGRTPETSKSETPATHQTAGTAPFHPELHGHTALAHE